MEIKRQMVHDKYKKTLVLTPILKTSSSIRKITIPEILVNYLREIKKNIKPSDEELLIKNRNGEMCKPRNLGMDFTKNIEKYKNNLRKITFHDLRHTHATLLIENGVNIKVISQRLGHKNINITLDIYTHVTEKMENQTANLLNNMFKSCI